MTTRLLLHRDASWLTAAALAAVPVALSLAPTGDLTYAGTLTVDAATPSGAAQAVFSGRDLVGNAGHEILSGGSLLLDTRGPGISATSVLPPAPIRNDPGAPVAVPANFLLDEAPVPSPSFSGLLSGAGRQPEPLAQLTNTSGTTWTGVCQLPADAGLAAPETLSFALAAADDLGNDGGVVSGGNAFQVYQGGLPPLPVPGGVAATSLPGGAIRVSWQAVAGASDYQLLRQAPGEPGLTPFVRTAGAPEWIDTPAVEGTYSYAVASVRTANEEE